MDLSRLGIGLGAALAFGVGAFRVATTDGAPDGWGLMAVGLVLAGVSIALELHDRWHR